MGQIHIEGESKERDLKAFIDVGCIAPVIRKLNFSVDRSALPSSPDPDLLKTDLFRLYPLLLRQTIFCAENPRDLFVVPLCQPQAIT